MRRHNRIKALIASLVLAMGVVVIGSSHAGSPPPGVSFKDDIMPILQIRCLECHTKGGSGLEKSGLNLDTYESLMKGTTFGPVITPGNAMTSNLLLLVEGKTAVRMPHNRKSLTKCEIDLLRDWVQKGAKNN